ncbi:hypothetical protein [Rhodospirillaceae bacterium SYSU D60014]|uniref:hypothetical protein n=1 Tax=Virgifigura deserti TaxID=2268457 RepID=UPI0013C49233
MDHELIPRHADAAGHAERRQRSVLDKDDRSVEPLLKLQKLILYLVTDQRFARAEGLVRTIVDSPNPERPVMTRISPLTIFSGTPFKANA